MEYLDLSELAALGALEILDLAQQDLLAEQLEKNPELEAIVTLYRTIFATIAYSAPPLEVPAKLKERLFQEIADSGGLNCNPVVPQVQRLAQIRWRSSRVPGVSIARLRVDKHQREVVYLLHAEAGACLPAHRHARSEEILVLEGDLIIDQAVYGRGNLIRSQAGSQHSPRTEAGCLAFVRASLDDQVLA